MTLSGESLGKKTTTTLAQILQNLFLDNEVERKKFFFFEKKCHDRRIPIYLTCCEVAKKNYDFLKFNFRAGTCPFSRCV